MPPLTTFHAPGDRIDHTPGSAVSAGDVVVQAELVGIATSDIAAGAVGSIAIEGVFKMPKPSGDGGIDAGDVVYWDVADQNVQEAADSGTNKRLGFCVADAADTDTTVLVKLSQ